MSNIGKFSKNDDGSFCGYVRTLLLTFELDLRPVEAKSEGAPGFRAYSDDLEVGAGWMRTGRDSGNAYMSVQLDDPSFAQPMQARLTKDSSGDGYTLWWERDTGRRSFKTQSPAF